MKDHGSAGRVHLNSVAREGEWVGLGAVTEQRLEEKKGAFFHPPPTRLSSISLLRMTPEAHPLIEDNVQGCVHSHACSHTNCYSITPHFWPNFLGEILCIPSACIKCYVGFGFGFVFGFLLFFFTIHTTVVFDCLAKAFVFARRYWACFVNCVWVYWADRTVYNSQNTAARSFIK